MLRSLLPNRYLIHLSLFDGIGVASLALQMLAQTADLTLSWELDPACVELLDHHFQPHHQGDVSQTNFHQVAQTLGAHLNHPDTTILITGGPPCPDFSRMRDAPPGIQGEWDNLIINIAEAIRTIRENFTAATVLYLVENVVPHPDRIRVG